MVKGVDIVWLIRKYEDKTAEGLSGRFVRIDREKFGVIPGVTDREYYTNSMHRICAIAA